MEEKVKKKTTFWLPPDMIDRMDGWLKADNCRSRNEFVEKALRFYMGYLGTEDNLSLIHIYPGPAARLLPLQMRQRAVSLAGAGSGVQADHLRNGRWTMNIVAYTLRL